MHVEDRLMYRQLQESNNSLLKMYDAINKLLQSLRKNMRRTGT
jgi:hypothetical protein